MYNLHLEIKWLQSQVCETRFLQECSFIPSFLPMGSHVFSIYILWFNLWIFQKKSEVFVYVSVCVYMCASLCVHTHMYTCVCVWICVDAPMCVHLYLMAHPALGHMCHTKHILAPTWPFSHNIFWIRELGTFHSFSSVADNSVNFQPRSVFCTSEWECCCSVLEVSLYVRQGMCMCFWKVTSLCMMLLLVL